MNRFPYQALAYPLPQDAELVRPETWARLPEPVFPKPRLRQEFVASGVGEALVIESIFIDKWQGYRPEQHLRARQPVREFGVLERDPASVVTVPELSWETEAPDYLRPKPHQLRLSGEMGVDPRLYLDVSHWLGYQPERIDRRKPRLPGLYATPLVATTYETPPLLAWQGPLPQIVNRHKPRPQGDRTAITEPSGFVTTTLDQWRGEQPALLNRMKRRTEGVFGHVEDSTVFVVSSMDAWFVQRPEMVHGHAPRPHGERLSITEPTILGDVVPSATAWRGYQPEYVLGPAPRPAGDIANIGPPDLQATPLVSAWHGYEPDIVNRAKPRPVTSYTGPVESSLMVVADVSTWLFTPQLVYRKPSRAHLPVAGVGSTYDANSVIDVGNWIVVDQQVYVPGG